MSNELLIQNHNSMIEFTNEKLQLIKDTICKGSSNEEFQLFIHACQRTGLDPLMRQVHAVKRWDSNLKRESMTIQTGIDGYRLIADRSGNYAPGKEPTFSYDKDGHLFSSTAYVKKRTPDGTWHEVSASAFYSEYAAMTRDGKPNTMWATKGHIMLSKCAEALALRKAFPAELSGIYTKEEMEQASNHTDIVVKDPVITKDEAEDLKSILKDCEIEYQEKVLEGLNKLHVNSIHEITQTLYPRVRNAAIKKRDEYQRKTIKQLETAQATV